MIFSEINASLSVFAKFAKFFKSRDKEPEAESIATRFVRLFESHGVHRNQIPRFFGHGLTVADVADDNVLLSKFTEDILDDACTNFAIRREWLDGASKRIYPIHFFYKDPEGFLNFTENLIKNNDSEYRQLSVLLLKSRKMSYGDQAFLLFEEEVGDVSGSPVYRYHLCDNHLIYSYWRCRAYLAAFVAMCFSRKIHVHGVSTSSKFIKSISDGEAMLGWNGEGVFGVKGTKWYPEDLALSTKNFLDGINPEMDKFGTRAALDLWLKLENQGYMKLGLNNDEEKNARELFEKEHKKYS